MAVKEATKSTFIESVEETLAGTKVWVFCKKGTMPLEWPAGCVDDDEGVITNSGKFMVTKKVRYRNIDTTTSKGQSAGYMELDPSSNVAVFGETDAQFLARIKDWIENSNDPRIEPCGVRIDSGNPFPLPFNNFDGMTADQVATVVMAQLTDDVATNMKMLRDYASYELNAGKREDVLAVLEEVAGLSGDESDDDGLVDDGS